MSSEFGYNIRVQLFGQSHGEGIGVVMDGLPAGERIDLARLQAFLDRRAPGKSALTTARREGDVPRILSGLVDGVTCGAPLCAVIDNTDTRSRDYSKLREFPRPGHADYPAHVKWGGANDVRGGGHFSARLTAPLCFAGAVCLQLLEKRGIFVGAHLLSVGSAYDTPFDPVSVDGDLLRALTEKPFPVLEEGAGLRMQEQIETVKAAGDSLGGVVECAVTGLPVGLGEPIFDGLENRIAAAVFGIPAVKGIEFGAGFAAAAMRGSEHNDPFVMAQDGSVRTASNNHGGILGGLASGMPLVFRAAFKPTPSIALAQKTVSLIKKENADLVIEGRHDPCVAVRAVPCVEAAAAISVYDLIAKEK